MQTHTATWTIDGIGSFDGTVTEDNYPAMDSGRVTGLLLAPSEHDPIHCAPYGHGFQGPVRYVRFTITTASPASNVDEGLAGSDTIKRPAASPVILGGRTHLSYVQSTGDVDVYEVLIYEA